MIRPTATQYDAGRFTLMERGEGTAPVKPLRPSPEPGLGQGQVPSPAEPQRDLKDEGADDVFRHHPLKRLLFLRPTGPL